MINVNTEKYELSYDDDYILIVDKTSDELIVRLFNKDIKNLNINAENTNLNLNVKNFKIVADEEIKIDSKLPRNVPSIFLNCDERFNNIG